MLEISFEIPPDPWHVRQILRLVITLRQPGENPENLGIALRAKHGPLPAAADAFYQWPTRNAVVMAFLDDQGVPPAF